MGSESLPKLSPATNLVTGPGGAANTSASGLLRTGIQSGLATSSLTAKLTLASIKFGNAPGSAPTSSATGGEWAKLLKEAASGSGFASAFNGGLSGLGGIGSMVSGIMSLFGSGKKSSPAVTAFRLPDSQEHAASIGTTVTYAGNVGQTSSNVLPGGVYSSPGQTQAASSNFDSQWFADNSNNIAQAVKTAMLNSHSLNDVVSEV